MGPFSFLLLVLLLLTRILNACLFTALTSCCASSALSRCPPAGLLQVPSRPAAPLSPTAEAAIDRPENTLAAIRQVSPPCLPPLRPSWEAWALARRFPSLFMMALAFPIRPQRIHSSGHQSVSMPENLLTSAREHCKYLCICYTQAMRIVMNKARKGSPPQSLLLSRRQALNK